MEVLNVGGPDISVSLRDDTVALVEMRRPPNNFFDAQLIRAIADAYAALDEHPGCRAIVLCADGKHFCAGANFGSPRSDDQPREDVPGLYDEAARMVGVKTPVVAAVHGAAIGGGLGVACSADFRVGCSATRMAANFSQLGFHHGFGLTALLPPLVGQQKTWDLLYTGRRVAGEEAFSLGLLDRFVADEDVRSEAIRFAAEIASSAPLAVRSIRATMREGLVERFRAATAHEQQEQNWLQKTADFKEGTAASIERRKPAFRGE